MDVYNIDETCAALKLKAPVLRKYSALLEDAGYTGIERNSSKARFYTDENIKVLRELIDYKESGYMTLNDAAKAIVERINGIDVIEDITPANIEHIAQRADVIKMQEALLMLTEHIQQQEAKHAESAADLMREMQYIRNELREMKESQQALAIEMKAQEEIAAAVEVVEEKRGIFGKLFTRKK